MAVAKEVDAWISDAVKEFGRLDGAANVAGLSKRTPDTTSANIVSSHLSFFIECLRRAERLAGRRRLGQNNSREPHRHHALHARAIKSHHEAWRLNRQRLQWSRYERRTRHALLLSYQMGDERLDEDCGGGVWACGYSDQYCYAVSSQVHLQPPSIENLI